MSHLPVQLARSTVGCGRGTGFCLLCIWALGHNKLPPSQGWVVLEGLLDLAFCLKTQEIIRASSSFLACRAAEEILEMGTRSHQRPRALPKQVVSAAGLSGDREIQLKRGYTCWCPRTGKHQMLSAAGIVGLWLRALVLHMLSFP